MHIPVSCTLCPRQCHANRTINSGLCHGGSQVKVARAALHFWEEPCISGTCGSGTVFFSGCTLQCCYCQNYKISAQNEGKTLTVRQLADVFLSLQAQGAHNINLVTATHYLPWVLEALSLVRDALFIPIVYNTGGYETPQTLRQLDGIVDIYLTDIKYASPQLSESYSHAADYFAYASAAAKQMIAQTGAPQLDATGILQKGVIIRHLALPGHIADSKAVLQFLADELPQDAFFTSLMSQYTPAYLAKNHPTLQRRISTYEYRKVVDYAIDLGLTNGYMQEKSSAKEEYTPPFDGTGLPES